MMTSPKAESLEEQGSFWPETPRDEAIIAPFPIAGLGRWLIPGAVGALLLAILFVIVSRQGARTILSMTSQGTLVSAPVAGEPGASLSPEGWTLAPSDLQRIQSSLTVLGGPQWSPDGRHYATTITGGGEPQVALFRRGDDEPTLISSAGSELVAVPGSGWSPTGQHLAILEWNEQRRQVTLLDLDLMKATPFDVQLAPGAGISWHGADAFLLVTRREVITPALALVWPTGEVTAYEPQDGAVGRADAAISPDTKEVAYITISKEHVADGVPVGSLWTADINAGGAREVITKGLNLAPVWTPAGDAILFSRYVTETNRMELRRVMPDGQDDRLLGPGTNLAWQRPYDRDKIVAWSPDGRRLFFLADEPQGQGVYLAEADGANAERLDVNCAVPESVAWAPTNRGLVISCSDGRTFLHWTGAERDDTPLPALHLPAWQP